MDLAPPRGTADLLPPRADAMLGLYDEAHRISRLYGFRYVETPTFEQTDLFVRTSGETSDVVTKEMYTFDDKGGRSLTLRPESTAGVMRAYVERAQALGSPFKAYYVATEFRHGRPQAGRLREFRQFGIEVIGVEVPAADVEVIDLGDRYLRDRGLRDVVLYVNSIGDAACRPAYRDTLVSYFQPYLDQLDEDCRTRLRKNPLRVFDCKVDGAKDFVLAAPTILDNLCPACSAHFEEVRAGLGEAGVAYELDPRLVRGLDYYTRTTFEWKSRVLSEGQGTVNAGGRYDGLAEAIGGPPIPAVGFALGLDRVLLAIEGEGAPPIATRAVRCFVVAIGEDARRAGLTIVRELREASASAMISYEDRPLKAQLRMADRYGAEFAAIIGRDELADGTVTLRRLAEGTQETVPAPELAKRVADADPRGPA